LDDEEVEVMVFYSTNTVVLQISIWIGRNYRLWRTSGGFGVLSGICEGVYS